MQSMYRQVGRWRAYLKAAWTRKASRRDFSEDHSNAAAWLRCAGESALRVGPVDLRACWAAGLAHAAAFEPLRKLMQGATPSFAGLATVRNVNVLQPCEVLIGCEERPLDGTDADEESSSDSEDNSSSAQLPASVSPRLNVGSGEPENVKCAIDEMTAAFDDWGLGESAMQQTGSIFVDGDREKGFKTTLLRTTFSSSIDCVDKDRRRKYAQSTSDVSLQRDVQASSDQRMSIAQIVEDPLLQPIVSLFQVRQGCYAVTVLQRLTTSTPITAAFMVIDIAGEAAHTLHCITCRPFEIEVHVLKEVAAL